MVEFVLILPVMMLILLIVADFGRFFSAYISDVNAAREGANYAAAQAADSAYTTIAFNQGIVDAATGQSNAQGQSGGDALDVSSKCFSPSAPSTPIDCHVASDYAGGIGNQVTVTVKQPFAFLTPFIGSLFGGSLTLTTSATAPIFNPKVASVTSSSLTITANNQTRVVGAADPAFTSVVSPSVSLTTPATCTSTATVLSPIGSYPITCSGAVLAGYSISYVAGTLTVTATPTPTPTATQCVPPVVTISTDPNPPTVEGADGLLNVTFTGTSSFSPASWLWDFGDGVTNTTVGSVTHLYTHPRQGNGWETWGAKLTVTAGASCSGSKTVTISVKP
jgi:Flp pilus assembly protein TadG